jgi:Zn finger protein HypA/HybF involved in hydrogenase expression
MHKEFSMMNNIFKNCLEIAKINNISCISEVNIEVGDFNLFVEIYAQEAFEIIKKGTVVENAVLNIKRTPGLLHCNSCDQNSEIWFDKEKEKAASEGRLKEYEEFEKAITEQSLLKGNPNLGRNVFYCRNCDSSDTNLIEGKGVLIRNIRL